MIEICDKKLCTGCGMCSNICPRGAVSLKTDNHGFDYPSIDEEKCVDCGLCLKRCPVNNDLNENSFNRQIYSVWNKDKKIRKASTSGGVFSALAKQVLAKNGAVAGVRWDDDFLPEHFITEKEEELCLMYGSKYVQSKTNYIYKDVKTLLESGKTVLFSGTPCQNHALQLFLAKEYDNLICVDLVCHGVPSRQMLRKYLDENEEANGSRVTNVRLRHKSPYWDYCNVTIDFENGKKYSVPTTDDPYFTLFNIGYSLRSSCHKCKYTNLNRVADITLMDNWAFKPNNFKMADYNKGISCVFVNTQKGKALFDEAITNLQVENCDEKVALRGNKCLKEPFVVDESKAEQFFNDYSNGMSVDELCKKYVREPFKVPKHMMLRRLKRKYGWIIKK